MKCGTKRVAKAGRYVCRFDRIEPVETFGRPADAYVFVVAEGDEAAAEIRKVVGQEMWVGNATHQFMSQLVGHDIAVGEDLDPANQFGSSFECVVAVGASGNGVVLKSVKPVSSDRR